MDKNTLLSNETLEQLNFYFDGEVWYHQEEEGFALLIEPECFFVSFRGYCAKYPHISTVGVLEKLYFD